MNKIIIIIGLLLVVIAAVVYYQFSMNKQMQTDNEITINDHAFFVETVSDPQAQQIGLTKYNSIKEDQGMLFIFEQPGDYGFWMKNMQFPIDILFINNDTIVTIVSNAEPAAADAENPTIYHADAPIDKVLEITAGLAEKYELKRGDKIQLK